MDRDKQRLLHVIIVVPRKKHTQKIRNHLNVKQISSIFTFNNIYKTVHKIVDWIKIFHFKPRISFLDTQYNINGVIWINCNVIRVAVQEVNFTLNLRSIIFFGSFKTFNKSIRTQLENLRDIGVLPTLQYIDLWYFLLVVWNLNFVITKPTATRTPLTRILLLYKYNFEQSLYNVLMRPTSAIIFKIPPKLDCSPARVICTNNQTKMVN